MTEKQCATCKFFDSVDYPEGLIYCCNIEEKLNEEELECKVNCRFYEMDEYYASNPKDKELIERELE